MPRRTELSKPQALLDAPKPPAGMTAAGRSVWTLTVASRPSAEWSAADATLLAIYVTCVLDVRRLDGEIAEHGEIDDGRLSPLVKLRDMRESRLLALASKLKLMPSNRYFGKDVARLHQHAKKAGAALATYDGDEDDLLAVAPTNSRH